MINLRELAPFSLGPDDDRRAQQQLEQSLMAHGRSAFLLGWPISKCPPFADDNMAWAWRQGWRNARDEADKKKTPPERGR
jgi:ribosome modulation factor